MLDRRIIFLAVLLRLGVYVFLHFSMGTASTGGISRSTFDTPFYLNSIENLLTYKHYTYSLDYLPAYAGRMPGYGVIYGLLRLLFSPSQACIGLILLQMALAIVAIYYLAKLSYALTKRRAIAYVVVFVHAISPFAAQGDVYLLTESFASSALIISSYYFYSGLTNKPNQLFIAGIWLTWVIFLRPFMVPLLGLWVIIYLYYNLEKIKRNQRRIWMGSIMFLLPFVVVDVAWTLRNWIVIKQFIPLQVPYAGLRMSPIYLEVRRFAAALGEDPVQGNTSSLMAWLTLPTTSTQATPKLWQLTSHGTYDSLVWLRQQIQINRAKELLPSTQRRDTQQIIAAVRRFHDAVVQEKPFLYYVVAPLRLTYYLVLTGGGNSIFAWPFNELARWQQGTRLLFTFSHWLLMGAALLSYLSWSRKLSAGWLLVRLPVIYLVVLFVVGLRYVESRYFIVVYPLALLSGVVWLTQRAETLARKFGWKAKIASSL